MYNRETEILFPARLIPDMREARGEKWQEFIDSIPASPDRLEFEAALVLFIVKQGGCVPCNSDSFRAMRGCRLCALQTIKRFKGSDQGLIDQVEAARKEYKNWLKKKTSGVFSPE